MNRTGGYNDHPLLAKLYDHVPAYRERRDVDFYRTLAREADGPVLELGCGTGRVLLPTARDGCRITGLDLSPQMLEILRENLQQETEETRNRVTLVQAPMTDFDLGQTFRLITTPFRPFQHLLDVEEQLACLACAHRHLEPGGRLVLDFFQVDPGKISDPVFHEEWQDVPELTLADGTKFSRSCRIAAFHRSRQYNDVELIYYITHPDSRTERLVQAFPFRYFYPFEIRHLLARTGFSVLSLYGDLEQGPFTDDSLEMIFVAGKAKN